ncbi:MAG: MarR family transcriptional regulator [Pseudonocardiaceae bacterium]|nr:MarR family transcriptional regulator [Pseudonocardiaceae bacterium]
MTTTTGTAKTAELAEALVRLTHLVQQVFNEVARQHDLTPQQVQLLCLVADGPVGMGELTRSLHLEKSSLTGLVDRVERRGLVARARDSHDRRACQIQLTGEGKRLAIESHHDVTGRLEALASELPPAERTRLTSAIARMVAADAAG